MENIVNQLPKEYRTKSYEYDSLSEIMKEGGIPLWSKFISEISILHTMERGYLPTNRNELIKVLRENTDWDYSKIVDLMNRVESFKTSYPSYNLSLNSKLSKVEQQYSTIVEFRWIGEGGNRKMIGIVEEDGKKIIYEHSGNHPILIGNITEDYSIHWNNYVQLTTPQQKYIVDEVKNLKGKIW